MKGAIPWRPMWALLLCAFCRVQAGIMTEGDLGRSRREETPPKFQYDPNCDVGYTSQNPKHSMCIVGDVGVDVPVDQANKDLIIKTHNDARKTVNPLAADMMKTIWDDDIAAVAAKWARQCYFGHDGTRNVLSLPGVYIGQNGHVGSYGWEGIVKAWISEIQYFEYGVGSTTGNWEDVGHYTQVVTSYTQRIGCGQANCNGRPQSFCNYAFGLYSTKTPYTNSTKSCSACPETCDASGKLCDCRGKLCFNGGTLDINTCTCSCANIYSGDICEILNCPSKDSSVCGPGNQFPPDNCQKFSNVPYSCPYMCGVCQHNCGAKQCYNGGTMDYKTCTCTCDTDFEGNECRSQVCGGKKCQNGGKLDQATCTCKCSSLYEGDTCESMNCPTNYMDSWVCGPGNQWPPEYCKYNNVPPSCPYMCGKCPHNCGTKQCYNAGTMDFNTCTCTCAKDFEGDECKVAVCGGKKCLNSGTLDKATCTCNCSSLYTGDTCQTLSCPVKDSWVCGPDNQWPPDFCKYSNVPDSCPYMCGKCPHM